MPDRGARLRLAAQNGAVRALVAADTAEQGVRGLLREVCTNLGWAVGEYWRPSREDQVLLIDAVWSDPAVGGDLEPFVEVGARMAFRPGQGLPGRVWQSGAPAWITDVDADPAFPRREAARAAGIRSAFAVPVPLGQDRRGVLEFFAGERVEPDDELLETMAAVGEYLGQFHRRRRAETALRASEDRFRTFGSTVADATFVIDEGGRIVYVNDAVRRIFGYSPSELLGAPLTRLMPERHRSRHAEELQRFLETGQRQLSWDGVQTEGLHRDGTEVPLEMTYGTFEKDGQRFFTGIARDITERRRAEERLRFQARLLDAVGEGVMATDLEGRLVYWNAYAEKLYGWRADEVLGRHVTEVTPANMSVARSHELMERLAAGKPWSGEFMVRDRSGREFPVLVNDSPIRDDDGRLLGVVGTSIEITERRRREDGQKFLAEASRALASSLDYAVTLRSVATLAVPYLGDWCLVHLRTGDQQPAQPVARVVPDAEAAAADTLEELLLARGLVDEVLAGDAAMIGPAEDGTAEGGTTEDGTAEGRTAEGRTTEDGTAEDGAAEDGTAALGADRLRSVGVEAYLIAPLRARGTALGVIIFARTRGGRAYDTTDAATAEELGRRAGLAIDNARLYREAAEGNRAKTDFLAVVSHELRTPLNAIAGYADLLAGGIAGQLNALQSRHVDRIKVGAGHLAHLIDEVLTYARVETGRDTLQLEATDVAQVAREAVVVLEPDAHDKGLALELDVPESALVLFTDVGKLRQILVNLLSNAVKYTEKGTVRVAVRAAEGGVEIDISDTGIGIAPEDCDRIFEPFWQAESPNTRTVGGTGLGLSVSRRLARLLDGDIEVESEPGVGSTFTVRLPDHAPPAEPEQNGAEPDRQPGREADRESGREPGPDERAGRGDGHPLRGSVRS